MSNEAEAPKPFDRSVLKIRCTCDIHLAKNENGELIVPFETISRIS
jgi:hypothetical protein